MSGIRPPRSGEPKGGMSALGELGNDANRPTWARSCPSCQFRNYGRFALETGPWRAGLEGPRRGANRRSIDGLPRLTPTPSARTHGPEAGPRRPQYGSGREEEVLRRSAPDRWSQGLEGEGSHILIMKNPGQTRSNPPREKLTA